VSDPHDLAWRAEAVAAPEPPATGDDAVDEAVATLRDVSAVPVDEQPAIYDAVHRALQDRLADVDG